LKRCPPEKKVESRNGVVNGVGTEQLVCGPANSVLPKAKEQREALNRDRKSKQKEEDSYSLWGQSA